MEKWFAIQLQHGRQTPVLFTERPARTENSVQLYDQLTPESIKQVPDDLLEASTFEVLARYEKDRLAPPPCVEFDPPTVVAVVDPVVEAVREDLLQRSQLGIEKYGVMLDRADLNLRDWLQHAYEEALDMANYMKRSIMELDGKP